MGDLLSVASAILSRSEHRVEVAAQNIANIATPGYKRRISFSDLLVSGGATSGPALSQYNATDFSEGKPIETGDPFNLAIFGNSFFVLGAGDHQAYSRDGQFRLDAEGRLMSPQGLALQTEGGGDLVLKGGEFQVLEDGVVLEGGVPVAKLALVELAPGQAARDGEGGLFHIPEEAATPAEGALVRQGMLESSNVSTGGEMVVIMDALRQAEAAQKLANVYDDLMGRALTTFGQV